MVTVTRLATTLSVSGTEGTVQEAVDSRISLMQDRTKEDGEWDLLSVR